MRAALYSVGIVLTVIFVWAAFEAITADCRTMSAGCFFAEGNWFHSYQTLIAGLLAFATALALLEIERGKRAADRRNAVTARMRDAEGLLSNIHTGMGSLRAAVRNNRAQDYSTSMEAVRLALDALGRNHNTQLSNWIAFQMFAASAAANLSFSRAVPDFALKDRSMAHIFAVQRYLDTKATFNEDGDLLVTVVVAPDVIELFDAIEVDAERSQLTGYIERN